VQAVLEGVAFALLDGRLALGPAWPGDGPVTIVGGGTRSRFWLRIAANVLGQPILRIAGAERGASFGAARLARLAVTGESPQAVCGKPAVTETIVPDRSLHARYADRFATFRGLYRALRHRR
jgi:xylulokinase